MTDDDPDPDPELPIRHDLPDDVVHALQDALAMLVEVEQATGSVRWRIRNGMDLAMIRDEVSDALEFHWKPTINMPPTPTPTPTEPD